MGSKLSDAVLEVIHRDVLERFLRYVQIETASDPLATPSEGPTTKGQWDLLNLLVAELRGLGVQEVELAPSGVVYARIPSNVSTNAPALGLLAHVDTSPDQPGDGVAPRLLENYDGGPISYPEDPTLTLTASECPELKDFVGDTLVVASGRTLLGADDKAGVAEIMSAVAQWMAFPEIPHGEIVVCFTPDEEVNRGTVGIDRTRLPKYCYTMDAGYPGELEAECFDAWGVEVRFTGVGVHPGYAKDKLVNSLRAASRFISFLPREEAPETTDGRDGFFHPHRLQGTVEHATLNILLRDFERPNNERRIEQLNAFAKTIEAEFPGLKVEVVPTPSYQNMREVLQNYPEMLEIARAAIQDTGLRVRNTEIRGGTDGTKLCFQGHPTPNVFAGGMLFHSRTEWIARSALEKATQTILYLADRWRQQ